MNNKKFDLNKFLQSPKLFTPIDYFGITVPSVSGTQEVVQNFEDWRKSQGYKTEEEKQEDLKAEMQAAQQRFNDQDLWNSEDPYEVYNTYQTDPEKQEEFKRNGEMVAGIGSTIATLPFTAGMMGGWTPAIVSTATGVAGGHAGAYGGQKLGQHLDDKYGTNLTPGLTFAGGLFGGALGGGIGYKGWEGATNQYLINKAFKSGQLRYGQPTSYTAYHQSATPITKFKFPFKRWDVAKHGADPNGAFFTVGQPAGSGFLAERPYTGQFQVKVQKPLIQTGELTGPTKNGLRNAIVRRARKNGADAVFFDGIADNTLQNQQILFAMDNADISFTGGPGKVRYFGPTMGKTTLVKTNNNYVDLDQLVKPLRKQVAEQLGLKVSDPRVAKSPEYQTALKQIVEEFQTNTANAGKTLVGSQKQLLNGDFVLDGEPMLPDFETFVARNQARGFKETPEQLRVWYDEILGLKPDIKVDNRYVSEIVYGKPSKLTEAERLGIPKGERSNLTVLEDPQYWGYEQWNERYNAAVRDGNWEEVQRLRDLHFKVKAPDTKIIDENGMPRHMYHGRPVVTQYKGENPMFTKFEGVNWDVEDAVEAGSLMNHWKLAKPVGNRMSSYHTPNYETAKKYAIGSTKKHLDGVMDNYLYIKNPANYNDVKRITGLDEISDWADFARGRKELMELGYDGLYIPQFYDAYGAFVSPSQFKSADPITWDGKGNIIPIVKRDNFRNLDTRYNEGGKIENPDH